MITRREASFTTFAYLTGTPSLSFSRSSFPSQASFHSPGRNPPLRHRPSTHANTGRAARRRAVSPEPLSHLHRLAIAVSPQPPSHLHRLAVAVSPQPLSVLHRHATAVS